VATAENSRYAQSTEPDELGTKFYANCISVPHSRFLGMGISSVPCTVYADGCCRCQHGKTTEPGGTANSCSVRNPPNQSTEDFLRTNGQGVSGRRRGVARLSFGHWAIVGADNRFGIVHTDIIGPPLHAVGGVRCCPRAFICLPDVVVLSCVNSTRLNGIVDDVDVET